jgi:ABC-type uncharacterized transport system permease subunit
LSLHVALIMLAYGLFGAAAAGMMYPLQEHDLKFEKVRAVPAPAVDGAPEKLVTSLWSRAWRC